MTQHSPTPWSSSIDTDDNVLIFDANGQEIGAMNWAREQHEIAVDTEFLLRSVNAYSALVAALTGLRGFMPPSGDDRVDAVLKAADAAIAHTKLPAA